MLGGPKLRSRERKVIGIARGIVVKHYARLRGVRKPETTPAERFKLVATDAGLKNFRSVKEVVQGRRNFSEETVKRLLKKLPLEARPFVELTFLTREGVLLILARKKKRASRKEKS